MSNRLLVKAQVDGAIEDYIDGIVPIGVISKQFDVSPNEFLKWVDLHKQKQQDAQSIQTGKGFPIMAEKLQEALQSQSEAIQADAPVRKERKKLTPLERMALIEAKAKGATYPALAERFDVSTATVANIWKQWEVDETERKRRLESMKIVPPPAPEVNISKFVEASEIGVFIEGDFIMLKIPKKAITHELLKGIL